MAGDWRQIPGNHVFDHLHQQVTAVARSEGNLDLFVIGNDKHIYTQAWPDPNRPGQWQWLPEWGAIPGNHVFDHLHQRIAAVSRGAGNLNLFVIGYDDRIYTQSWPDPNRPGQWQWLPEWGAIPGNHVFDHLHQQVTAVSRCQRSLDLFVIGHPDHRVYEQGPGSGGWGWRPDWQPIVGLPFFDHRYQQVAAVARCPDYYVNGTVDLFAIADDDRVYTAP